jgi:hypothetical protein
MTLTVETGTGSATADSYDTLANLRLYASNRGVTLPEDDVVAEVQARIAFGVLNGYGERYKGSKRTAAQAGQWPRSDVVIDGFDFANDAIPVQLMQAQAELMMAQTDGVDLTPAGTSARVIEEQVGPIRTRYSEAFGTPEGTAPRLPAVDALLRPLLDRGGLGGLSTIRV